MTKLVSTSEVNTGNFVCGCQKKTSTHEKADTPTQHKWVTAEHGNQRKVEVPKRIKRWWTASVDGKINHVVRYGSKPLEFTKGKNAIELVNEEEVAGVLAKVREAAENGELDALIEQQAQFGRRVTQKNKLQVKWRTCLV